MSHKSNSMICPMGINILSVGDHAARWARDVDVPFLLDFLLQGIVSTLFFKKEIKSLPLQIPILPSAST